jgi:hypothetical protein
VRQPFEQEKHSDGDDGEDAEIDSELHCQLTFKAYRKQAHQDIGGPCPGNREIL